MGISVKTNNALYDHRITYETLSDKKKLEDLLKWLCKVPVYSIWIFNQYTTDPSILSLEEHKKRAEYLYKIIPRFSKIGVIPGINILCTQGHSITRALIKEEFGFQPVVGPNGIESDGSVCALDENFLEYVFKMYQLYAKTGTRQIWTDDDIRMGAHGQSDRLHGSHIRIRTGALGQSDCTVYCYCPLHLERLYKETNKKWKVWELANVLSDSSEKEIHRIVNKIDNNSILNLYKHIEKAIHDIDPGIRIGHMSTYNMNRNIDKELQALKGKKADPLLRPGGEYWYEDDLFGALKKRIRIRSNLPFKEKDIEISCEIENYPYWPNLKSLTAIKLEMDLAVLDGSDRISFNILGDFAEPVMVKEGYIKLLKERHDFLLCLKKTIKEKNKCGVNIIRNTDYSKHRGFENWSNNLSRLGIPTISDSMDSPPTIICDRAYEEMDDRTISHIIEEGAIIERNTLLNLIDRGILSTKDILDSGKEINVKDIPYEKYTDNSINGNLAGKKQYCFGLPDSFILKIENEKKFSVLSEWIGTDGRVIAPSLILYNGIKAPSLVFPYNISEGPSRIFEYDVPNIALLAEEKANQLGGFLSHSPNYNGVWVKDMNCFPILYKKDNNIILGISRFSLDALDKYTIWISSRLGRPKDNIEVLNKTGEWESVEFKLKNEQKTSSGYLLIIRRESAPMSMNVFRWEIE